MIDFERADAIRLSQIHVAATMTKENQIVVGNLGNLTNVFSSHKLARYDCFGLRDRGNFTAHNLQVDLVDQFPDISYFQVSTVAIADDNLLLRRSSLYSCPFFHLFFTIPSNFSVSVLSRKLSSSAQGSSRR